MQPCGANADTRMAIRFIVEVAWQAHFVKNMFIILLLKSWKNFEPSFVVYTLPKQKLKTSKELGLNERRYVQHHNT